MCSDITTTIHYGWAVIKDMNVQLYIRKLLKVISYVSSVKSGQKRKLIVISFLLLWHETHQAEHRSDFLPTLSWNLRFFPYCRISNRSRNICSAPPRGVPRSGTTSIQPRGALAISAKEKFPRRNPFRVWMVTGDTSGRNQGLVWQHLGKALIIICHTEKHHWVSGFQMSYDFFLFFAHAGKPYSLLLSQANNSQRFCSSKSPVPEPRTYGTLKCNSWSQEIKERRKSELCFFHYVICFPLMSRYL